MENKQSVYETLASVDVKSKVVKKGNVDYLSWSNAWHMLKENYPNAQRNVYEDQATGWNYFSDGKSAWVKVGVVVDGVEHIDYLPVMDFRNKSVNVDTVTSMDVNKTIQRSTTKAIAMHGLGLSLWKGEDIPEMTVEPKEVKLVPLKVDDSNWAKVKSYVVANKEIGILKITENLSAKYIIPAATKTELQKLLK